MPQKNLQALSPKKKGVRLGYLSILGHAVGVDNEIYSWFEFRL
jgi:hypothetical protein